MNRTYGYCRISTSKQNIARQIRNITRSYPDAKIIEETYTGTTTDRPASASSSREIPLSLTPSPECPAMHRKASNCTRGYTIRASS